LWGRNEGIERRDVKALSAGRASQNKRKRQGKGASHQNDSRRAPHSVRGGERRQSSVKDKDNRVLLDSEVGGSRDLPPIVK
jgi:hypothetical protein